MGEVEAPIDILSSEIPEKYEKLLAQSECDAKNQTVEIKERLKRYIRNDEEHKLICGMLDHLVFLEKKRAMAESLLKSELVTYRNVQAMMAACAAQRVMAISNLLPARE